jgi:hypothetical protein
MSKKGNFRDYPAGGYKLPVNPELSRREHAKAVSESLIVYMHARMDLMKFWDELRQRNPFKFAEMMLNRFPDMLQPQHQQIAILVPSYREIPATQIPGVLNSPVQGHVAERALPELRLVETIDADDEERSS